jgi:phthiocerol/phenolphthiocerol synthesis type-I polyketide synthase D
MAVARWLVDRGAGRVVLNGRSAPAEHQRKSLTELAAVADVVVVRGDIAAPGVADDVVTAAEATGRSLRGVLHCAAVLDDQLVVGLTEQSLERVWAPKAAGAVRLHQATVGRDLDFWVGFSSVASLLGSPGQAAYACANAWLDALVDWRRAAGLPATAINWGQWSDVGLARDLTLRVLDPITPAEAVEALESVLAADCGRIGVARLRLDRAVAAFPEILRLGYFGAMVSELEAADTGGDWVGPPALAGMTADEAARTITARLRSRISAVMGYSGDAAMQTDQPLTDLGIDSLMAVRIRNTVRGDFGVEPPVALLLQGATLSDLAGELLRELHPNEGDDSEPANPLRDRVDQRAAARQRAAMRRKAGQRT